ncbi:MAG: hypothetical protein CVU62_12900 [Deltaproteobacteria bacterium HGW-Deltaproteobacteria-2]|jgi:hypothetical protein|nr:MAG: hypothetical protein CVU62_12900 [Deltaproteobacteria bacterium HGW-Deltaproteobacteria-2]
MKTTPQKISKRIRSFINTLGDIDEPEYLLFTNCSNKYLPQHCLSNCEAESHFTDSPVVFGWVIWEDKKTRSMVAEFHAVIRRKNKLVDITPRVDGESRVLFVPDKERVASRLNERQWNTWQNHSANIHTKPCVVINSHNDKLF